MDTKTIPLDTILVDIGIDSLSSLELASDLATKFGFTVDSFDLQQMTAADVLTQIGGSAPSVAKVSTDLSDNTLAVSKPSSISNPIVSHHAPSEPITFHEPFDALTSLEARFDSIASKRGYSKYWSDVAPMQNELLVAYILEAFSDMSVDITSLPLGAVIPSLSHHAKYERLMQRFWEILQSHEIITLLDGAVLRGHATPTSTKSSELHESFTRRFPQYAPEAQLMRLAGQKLAECLQGWKDPVAVLFGGATSSQILEDYYHNSPMLSAATDTLVAYIRTLLRDIKPTREQPLRILEAGAGTGGTTARLADAISSMGIPCEYTFSDISPVLVAKAKSKFAKYPWMYFTSLDLEVDMRQDLRSKYHIIISTNCVHATKNRATSCGRLRDALADRGILILSEVTRVVDWYDLVFGLLDGWWYAGNGTEYPIQPASVWMGALEGSGFASFGFSKGESEEAKSQQLLVGVAGH
jgi:SAM-dependent methyltransferase